MTHKPVVDSLIDQFGLKGVLNVATKLRKARERGRKTEGLRLEFANAMVEVAASNKAKVSKLGRVVGITFPDGGADVYLPIEELGIYAQAGYLLPPESQRGDLLHVLAEESTDIVVVAHWLVGAYAVFAEVHLWYFDPFGNYVPRTVRPYLRLLFADIEAAGGAREFLDREAGISREGNVVPMNVLELVRRLERFRELARELL